MSTICVCPLNNLVSLLTDVRQRVFEWEMHSQTCWPKFSSLTSANISQLSSVQRPNYYYPGRQPHRRGELTRRFQSAVERSADSLSHRFFPFNLMELPTGEECGLEIFGTHSPDLQDPQLGLSSVNSGPAVKRTLDDSESPIASDSFASMNMAPYHRSSDSCHVSSTSAPPTATCSDTECSETVYNGFSNRKKSSFASSPPPSLCDLTNDC